MELLNLTDLEVAVLPKEFNLSDGHAYRKCNPAEQAVLDASSARFRQLDRRQQRALEAEYFTTFFTLGQQTLDLAAFERFPCFTASAGIEIIANYLRLNDLSVALIEPCFDNLKDILRRHQVPLQVFPDHLLAGDPDALEAFLENTTTDVLFLVSPNNPTGTTLAPANFERVLDVCARRGTTLVLDTCFRFYVPEAEVYDQYALLAAADIDCIVIEDTGKTWPTLEIKAPFISVSKRLVDPIARINSDFLLHVSPFAIGLMADLLKLSIKDQRGHIRDVIAQNRATLYEALAPTWLVPVEQPYMSMAWCRIDTDMTAVEVTRLLADNDVHVLPGNHFFWSDESLGDSFIRISLARDPQMFARAATTISAALMGRRAPVGVTR